MGTGNPMNQPSHLNIWENMETTIFGQRIAHASLTLSSLRSTRRPIPMPRRRTPQSKLGPRQHPPAGLERSAWSGELAGHYRKDDVDCGHYGRRRSLSDRPRDAEDDWPLTGLADIVIAADAGV